MSAIDLHTPDTLGWRALMTRAQARSGIVLAADVEAYLLRVLRAYLRDPACLGETVWRELGARVVGRRHGERDDLRLVGDHCLLLSGLLPEQAIRHRVPLGYFVQVGRHAYREHAARSQDRLFSRLQEHFVALMDVLGALRAEGGSGSLDPLTTYQLWRETGSRRAFRELAELSGALPAACSSGAIH